MKQLDLELAPKGPDVVSKAFVCRKCPMVGGTDWDYGNERCFLAHLNYERRMLAGENLAPQRAKRP